ncbi:MAG: caspase family protein [Ginsengibacter sp.]
MRSICLSIAICFCQAISGQGYYYFVYESPQIDGVSQMFKSFLTLQPDGTATVRVQYNAGKDNKLYLYEIALKDSSFGTVNNNLKYLMPYKEAIPLIEEDTSGILLPRFIFKKEYDSSGYYYTPEKVEIKDASGSWLATRVTIHQQKTFEELKNDESFISSFYFKSDAFYGYVFDQTTRAIPPPRTEKMYLILVANTNDETVGVSAATDFKNVSKLFSNLAGDLGISQFIPTYIFGNGYSRQAVEAALDKLAGMKPSSKDIVIFYFSGHGFRLTDDVSKYPRMSFRTVSNKANKEVGENMPLEDVYKRILALKAGVTMVLGDCCNADIYDNPVLGSDMIRPKGGGVLGNFSLESGKKLFFPPEPLSIIIGSVQKGHLSVGNPETGGYFTHYFTSELEKNLWGYFSDNLFSSSAGKGSAAWLSISIAAAKNTYWKSKAKQCGPTPNDRCIQEAEISVNTPK